MSETPNLEDAAVIERQAARAANVSYAEPVVLHSTREKYIKFIPYTVKDSSGEHFGLKLETGHPKKPFEKVSAISFDSEAVRKLQVALEQHATVMTSGFEGKYISVRIDDGATPEGTDAITLLRAGMAMLSKPSVMEQLLSNPTLLTNATRQAVRLSELRSAVNELRALLDAGVDEESRYQSWLSQHSWIFGVEYMNADDVRGMTARDNVDAFIPRHANGFREIVELKIPSMPVMHYDPAHRNYYFSAEVSKAIGQVHRYLDKFVERGSTGIDDYEDIVAYHPVATIVIGRSDQWDAEKHRALRGLNSRLHGIDVITFDYLLKRGERLLEIISPEQEPTSPP